MVILEVDDEAMAGNIKTVVSKSGEGLRVGDRVAVICRGRGGAENGIVVDELADAWVVWVS